MKYKHMFLSGVVGLVSVGLMFGGVYVYSFTKCTPLESVISKSMFVGEELSSVIKEAKIENTRMRSMSFDLETQKKYIIDGQLSSVMGVHKVYKVRPDIVKYEATKDFHSLIEYDDGYQWEYSMQNTKGETISSGLFWYYDGKWQLGKVGEDIPKEYMSILETPFSMANYIEDNNLDGDNIVDVMHLKCATYDLLLIEDKDGVEYIIPFMFDNVAKQKGLESGKLYKVEDVYENILEDITLLESLMLLPGSE